MKLGSILTGSKHEAFAQALAKEFISSIPPELTKNLSNKKNNQKFRKAINKLGVKARSYLGSVKLGIYGKAKIGNTFMWMLKEEGYDEEMIESITNDLLHTLSGK